MKKNTYLILSCITILSFIITLQAIPLVNSLTTTINDGQNDVIMMRGLMPSDQGNYADEIDIVKLDIDGQKINLTFAADLESISFNHSWIDVEIMIFETFNTSLDPWDQLQYSIKYMPPPFTDYQVQFCWNDPHNGGYSHHYWDGSTFNPNAYWAIPIGDIDANLIWAEIPTDALNISDGFTFVVETFYGYIFNSSWYYDCMPDQYAEYYYVGGIPGYGIFIMLGAMFGITAIIIKKRLK